MDEPESEDAGMNGTEIVGLIFGVLAFASILVVIAFIMVDWRNYYTKPAQKKI